MAVVKEALLWTDALRDELKSYLGIDLDRDHMDVLLESLFTGAVEEADGFLNNPFVEEIPRVTFAGVLVGDSISVNGLAFTAATVEDKEEREFAKGATDTTAAAAFAAMVNDTTVAGTYAVGVRGVKATAAGAVVTLERIKPTAAHPSVYSDEDTRLRVEYVETAIAIPPCVKRWVFGTVARHFERRGTGLASEQIPGVQTKAWADGDVAMIQHLRFEPGEAMTL